MTSLLASIALALTMTTSTVAQGNRYAVLTIENPTNITINYQLRWGDNEWKSYKVAPGECRWHSWEYEYEDKNRSPVPYVRFDYDLDDDIESQEYRLEAYASQNQGCVYGMKYLFRKVAGGSRLELYKD